MRQRPSSESLNNLTTALLEVLESGWDDRYNVLWDVREKLLEFERLSNETGSIHSFLFAQDRERKSLITYLLISMNNIHEQVSRELASNIVVDKD